MNSAASRRADTLSLSLVGLDVHRVEVAAEAQRGPSAFGLVGLTEASAREVRIRTCAALQGMGFDLDGHGITVTITPPQTGTGSSQFDVAVAAAVLAAGGWAPAKALAGVALIGELSYGGVIRPVRGVLPALRGAVAQGITRAIVPRNNAREAAVVDGVNVCVVGHLGELVGHLKGEQRWKGPGEPPPFPVEGGRIEFDLATIQGQHSARRVLEIAASGGHHVLFVGPPGSGKSLLARRLPEILPPLTHAQALDVTSIHSVAGLLSRDEGLLTARPFRAPHHTVSAAGLVGGGDPIRPGEVSLAHHGVLFLDELPEFRRGVLDALGMGSLAKRRATIARRGQVTTFPARPLVVGAMNPCPCGFAGSKGRVCSCSPERVKAYRARLGRSVLDHIDLEVCMAPVELAQLSGLLPESSAAVRARVVAARTMQRARQEAREVAPSLNGELERRDLERVAVPDENGKKLLTRAFERLGLPALACWKVLRVARTIADLDGSTAVHAPHVAEALQAVQVHHDRPHG